MQDVRAARIAEGHVPVLDAPARPRQRSRVRPFLHQARRVEQRRDPLRAGGGALEPGGRAAEAADRAVEIADRADERRQRAQGEGAGAHLQGAHDHQQQRADRGRGVDQQGQDGLDRAPIAARPAGRGRGGGEAVGLLPLAAERLHHGQGVEGGLGQGHPGADPAPGDAVGAAHARGVADRGQDQQRHHDQRRAA